MLALFGTGFSTFAILYCVQPLLPVFAREFGITPAESSLALSLTTGLLAFTLVAGGALSDRWGRKQAMFYSLLASAALTLLTAAAGAWPQVLLLRALLGLTLSGLPGVAVTYIAEEMHPRSVSIAMGLFVGGNAIGGLAGRFLAGALAERLSWRMAMAIIGGFTLLVALAVGRALPPSRHSAPRPASAALVRRAFALHLRDTGLPWLFVVGFLLMGSFVTIYNYIGFRLLEPPFSLSQSAVAAIFAVYLAGIVSSSVAGRLGARFTLRRVLPGTLLTMLAGLALLFFESLPVVILGLALYTAGFFAGHTVASSWVGRRAQTDKAHASSLYLLFYYVGGSVMGTIGGVVWAQWRWNGLGALLGAMVIAALAIAQRLSTLAPIAPLPPRESSETRSPADSMS